MKGTATKLYIYENTSPRINIPLKIVEGLNWGHSDDLRIEIKTIEGNTGLFIYKKTDKENNFPK